MKTIQTFLLGAALFMAAFSTLQAQTTVRINADRVNLRAKPLLTAEVLSQVNYGDQLVAREIGEEWIEVAAPAAIDLWVSKDYVQAPDYVVNTRRVNLRAGPSIDYNVVDVLERGATVQVRGELDQWLKIAPPPSTHVWVHRDFVEFASGDAPAAVEAAAPEAAPETQTADAKPSRKRKPKTEDATEPASADPVPDSAPVAQPPPAAAEPEQIPTPIVYASVPEKNERVRDIPVPAPADLKLIPLEGQGRLAEFEGELRAAPLINEAPTRYRVVRWQNNRWQILCHVYGEAAKFRSLQDKVVRVKGREYWIQGAAAPVLVPDQIQEAAPPAAP